MVCRRRPRREGDEIEAHGAQPGNGPFQRGANALGQHQPLARRGRVGHRRLLADPDDPQLQRRRRVALLRVGEDHLDRAAAQIEQGHAPLAQIQAAAGAQVDQARLLVAANDADLDADLVAHGAHELAAVLGLAHRAGGDGDQGVGLVAVGDAAQGAQRRQAALEDLGRDDAGAQRGVAQAHHLLGPVADLDAPAGFHLGDDQVEGVGSDIQGGNAHKEDLIAPLLRDREFPVTTPSKPGDKVVPCFIGRWPS